MTAQINVPMTTVEDTRTAARVVNTEPVPVKSVSASLIPNAPVVAVTLETEHYGMYTLNLVLSPAGAACLARQLRKVVKQYLRPEDGQYQ